ncbi:MAG: hypothetical protein A2445_01255 [Candidatus Jacksonbacteria bacterium RIFOXYC2_FULL_44_29]|nr:MAG: hypothetical protein A2240_05285 [Candidatus Jacksonbacteria bacterium RIFOXYA2_FULL_43_12]OGY76517.1 MAG: hypothetical protein A2295_02070 [Candidatus Jacksonbacteria bacterium RIFOXYB2_FULL_44_15]OGY78497.1 MAG: hypothetical protein A2445_01255 [Candidatus Jacksonbacteria bacterium RIFOXYC2_FULL_44_29]OGY81154.1 MAG: hypothetical protein A2550_01650 [Candidatus Jacksonbacteria bacterium RIFOXYD2_FULL_43_21]HBH45756.1 hypothetical protein [Candidatus Jacksonbacteria bacterium]
MRHLKYAVATIIFFNFFIFSLSTSQAIGLLDLGDKCLYSHECAELQGCRPSELGDYNVCKFTVPNARGCAVNLGEDMCGDKMTCKDNTCRSNFGLDEGGVGFNIATDESGVVVATGGSSFTLGDFFSTTEDQAIDFAKKAATLILAIALLVGVTLTVKGFMVYRVAIGYVPMQRRGLRYIAFGVSIFCVSIFLWLLFF